MTRYSAPLIPKTVRCVCLNVLYPVTVPTPDGLSQTTVLEDWRGRRVDVCPWCGAGSDAILEADWLRSAWMDYAPWADPDDWAEGLAPGVQ